ncbi:MAG: transcriptional regulator, LuxR family with repeat, partial [Daejeonella sp.]|nr:transcriptional regulator, LuxR family with repeat [Daejeonella sp.]
DHMPNNIHLAILTRADPLLPIAKLRSQQQLVELRSADLSFSADETQFLFNRKLKLKISFDDVQSLANKTEGWIAGLQLIALSLRGREDVSAFVKDFKGDNRYIMDYLIEEVLKSQTIEIREFLLQTSLLEQLSGPLCDALLDRNESQTTLEMLERNNVFIVSLDEERRWYRYHHLFGDLLKQRLLLRQSSAVMELHTKAAVWFEQNRMYPLAIEHMLQTQNYDKAILLLVEIVERMWEKGHHASIIKYGDLLPDHTIEKHPVFCLFYAWVLITAGQTDKASQLLVCAEKITSQELVSGQAGGEEPPYQRKLLSKIAVAMAYQYSLMGKPEVILEYCHSALKTLSEEDSLWFSWAWYAIGMAQLSKGDISDSTEALEKAMASGKKSGNIYLITTIATTLAFNEGRLGLYKKSYKRSTDLLQFLKDNGYASLIKTDWTYAVLFANMAAIQYFWADLEAASENIEIAYNLCIKEADMTSKVLVLIVYSVVLHGQGDIAGAEVRIREMEAIMQRSKVNPYRESMYIGWKAIFLISQGKLEQAHDFLKENGVGADKTISYTDEYRYFAFALLLMAENNVEQALPLLLQLYEMLSVQNRIERMVEIKVSLSIGFLAMGEKEKALESLIESLLLASPDEILMGHLSYLDKINPLLQQVFKLQAMGKINLPNRYINKLKSAIEKRKNLPLGNLSFTTRERDALQLMAENLSNQEIADKLFISLNTVKTRLKNLFVKLDVDSRIKAVEKARELHLI